MPANNVDLTAILPALAEAAEPFIKGMDRAHAFHPATKLRNYAPISEMNIGQLTKLLESVQAVRRLAGDIK